MSETGPLSIQPAEVSTAVEQKPQIDNRSRLASIEEEIKITRARHDANSYENRYLPLLSIRRLLTAPQLLTPQQ